MINLHNPIYGINNNILRGGLEIVLQLVALEISVRKLSGDN